MLGIGLVYLPVMAGVAYLILGERKYMGSMQRRKGPNKVGIYGLIQPLADGLKLFVKETIFGSQIEKRGYFILAPVMTFIFSLLGWIVIPFGEGLSLVDWNLGLLYQLAISSLGVLGIILAGWSANSKYPLLGSLRTTAQMISYEVILGLIIGIVILLSNTLHLTLIIEIQRYGIWNIVPLLPLALIFFISGLAETNRAPMDLPESESELVAGYMTEHSSFIFALFFLAEYSNMILISFLTVILFLGGYLLIDDMLINNIEWLKSMSTGLIIGIKASFILFMFVWVRASYPRIRYDQLIALCWTSLLPIVLGIFVLVGSIMISFT